jgi:hypothetical protein
MAALRRALRATEAFSASHFAQRLGAFGETRLDPRAAATADSIAESRFSSQLYRIGGKDGSDVTAA